MQFFFLDESGVLGLSEKTSQYFVLTILQTKELNRLKNALRRQKKIFHDLGWPKDEEIKGTTLHGCQHIAGVSDKLLTERRTYIKNFIQEIINAGITVHYTVVNRLRITDNLRAAPYGVAYNYFSGKLLSAIHAGKIREPISLVVDQRHTSPQNGVPFTSYVQTRIITECDHRHAFTVRHEDSREWLGLQAADMISWGLFRHYEHGDSAFRKLITPRLGVRCAWDV